MCSVKSWHLPRVTMSARPCQDDWTPPSWALLILRSASVTSSRRGSMLPSGRQRAAGSSRPHPHPNTCQRGGGSLEEH